MRSMALPLIGERPRDNCGCGERRRASVKYLLWVLFASLLLVACAAESTAPEAEIEEVLDRNEQMLLSVDGVEGIGIQENPAGETVIAVYVRDSGVEKHVPSELEGIPVETILSGELGIMTDQFEQPGTNVTEEAAMPEPFEGAEGTVSGSEVERVLARNEQQLLSIDGVEGVGIQQNLVGETVIAVYVRDRSAGERVPSELEGVPVEKVVSGEFEAY
jgi:hypothetical protein